MRRSLPRLVLLLSTVAMAAICPVRAEVIITEIMYNADGADQSGSINREWAEIYNTGATAVNIGGWQFGDANDNQWASAFPAGTIIQPGQALVVTGDAASFDLEWGAGINRVQVSSFPPLANSPSTNVERPAIRNGSGQIVDAVQYNENFSAPVDPWPMIDDGSNGHSIFAVPQGLSAAANDLGRYWKPSVRGVYGGQYRSADGENYGSPGFVETVPQAPFAPSPNAAWSMVILPDTQNYVKWDYYQPLLPKITEWMRDNRDAYKIQVVLQEGDIVNNNDTNNPTSGNQTSSQQWPAAQDGMFVLNGHLPYIMAAGNHDFGFTNADNRDTMVNNYFKPSDNPLNDPAQGGILKGTMVADDITNAYYAFTAPDSRKMLIFSLEWEPRPATVAWANQIAALPQYADHTAVLLTHNYLQANDTRSTATNVAADYSGDELWQGLVKTNQNFQLAFNGHFGGDGEGYLASTNNAGKAVHQMFFNTQFETMGGNGWIRLVEFLDDGQTVRVRTYSPLLDLYRTTPEYDFQFQLAPIPPVPGDYNGNRVVDAGDYLLWRKTFGSRANLAADGNGDGVVTEADYLYWRQRFGNPFTPAAGLSLAAVPENSTWLYLCVATAGYFALTLRRTNRIPLSLWERAGVRVP
jgi:hypothetical protein